MITITEPNGSVYHVPIAGSFYVPPRYRYVVANIVPAQGDFARGNRHISDVGYPTAFLSPR